MTQSIARPRVVSSDTQRGSPQDRTPPGQALTTKWPVLHYGNVPKVDPYSPSWRLLDLWNCTYVVGHACLGIDLHASRSPAHPPWYEAALVLAGVCAACLAYLVLRIRAVEVVTG